MVSSLGHLTPRTIKLIASSWYGGATYASRLIKKLMDVRPRQMNQDVGECSWKWKMMVFSSNSTTLFIFSRFVWQRWCKKNRRDCDEYVKIFTDVTFASMDLLIANARIFFLVRLVHLFISFVKKCCRRGRQKRCNTFVHHRHRHRQSSIIKTGDSHKYWNQIRWMH